MALNIGQSPVGHTRIACIVPTAGANRGQKTLTRKKIDSPIPFSATFVRLTDFGLFLVPRVVQRGEAAEFRMQQDKIM